MKRRSNNRLCNLKSIVLNSANLVVKKCIITIGLHAHVTNVAYFSDMHFQVGFECKVLIETLITRNSISLCPAGKAIHF